MEPPSKSLLVGIVGPCGSGKSTLIAGLEKHGFSCRHIAQEHSYVQAMWQIITKPDVLIYLHAPSPISTARRKLNWRIEDYEEQSRRLSHAQEHAHIIINKDDLPPDEVLQKALDYLDKIRGRLESALFSSRPQTKAHLLKVMIEGESIDQPFAAHDSETQEIDEREQFVVIAFE